jgi:ankyrin repeat protein
MASEGPIGFLEGMQLKFSNWVSGKSIQDGLMEAVSNSDLRKIEWYVQHGADLNEPNWDSPFRHALLFCEYHLVPEYVEKLISLGADVKAENELTGQTLLHAACDIGCFTVIYDCIPQCVLDLFIKEGLDLNAMNCGYTALWLAAQKGRVRDVEQLIIAGADFNRLGNNVFCASPHSPLEAALRAGHHDVVALLRRHGAIEPTASHVASSSSSQAITPSASMTAKRRKVPAKHPRKETSVKEIASKRARKR